MQLIKGDKLTTSQRADVLRRFVHRWTHENKTYGGRCPGCVQHDQHGGSPNYPTSTSVHDGKTWHEYHAPLVSDAEWLAAHAFYVTKAGRLSNRHSHCEPHYLANAVA